MIRTTFILISFFLFFTACSEQQAQPSGVDLTGFETTTSNGVTIATKKNNKGELEEKGYIANGQKDGAWMTYYPDKKRIKTLTTFIGGVMNGPHLEFSNRGQIEKKINYTNNTYNGVFSTYKNGRAVKEMEYNHGELTGEYREYDTRGNLQKLTNFKDGKPHGKMIFYDEESVVMEYEYVNGEKVSGGIVEKKEEAPAEE